MGSAISHGIQLPPVNTSTFSTPHHYNGRRINRFAHPHNRVLPPPVAGQRLRTTDNGSILLEKGTIRGQRGGGSPQPSDVDPEFLAAIQRRAGKYLADNGSSISGKFHSNSDPNITYSLQISDINGKVKSRKKTRAPDPPSTSPFTSRNTSLNRRKKNGIKSKSPAPPPPVILMRQSSIPKSPAQRKPVIILPREEETTESSDGQNESSRHLIFERKNTKETTSKIVNGNIKNINYVVPKEIRQTGDVIVENPMHKNLVEIQRRENLHTNPKSYYFPDVEIRKSENQIKKAEKQSKCAIKTDQANEHNQSKKRDYLKDSKKALNTKKDQIDMDKLQRNNRIAYRQPSVRGWASADNSAESCCDSSDTLPSLSDSEDDINLKLRPTLPRRQTEVPRFSPTEAWKLLRVQHFDSVPSSEGGDKDERRWQINKFTSSSRAMLERCEDSGISPDAESPVLVKDKYEGLKIHPQTLLIGQSSWIPQQDLLEDSDSNELEDCVPNHRLVKVPVKLTLPNEMFSSKLKNMLNRSVNNDSDYIENHHRSKRVTGQKNTRRLNHLKKTLGMRNKNPHAECLDSNWVLNHQNNKNCKLTGSYKYVNSGGRKQLQSLIFGIKKNKKDEEILESKNHKAIQNSNVQRKFSFYSTEGHLIYLPEYETVDLARKQMKKREIERNNSRRKKKTSDKSVIEMTNMANDQWLFQMQKQYKQKKEETNTKEVDMHPASEEEPVRTRSQSYENIPDRTSSPVLGGWKSIPNGLNILHPSKIHCSVSSSSSSEVVRCNNRKLYTGASKWMRRQRQPPQNRNFSPTRPEPEGGGATSEEHGDDQTADDSMAETGNQLTRKPSVYAQLMEVAEEEEQRLKAEQPSNVQTNGRSTKCELKQRIESGKEGTESSWRFKPCLPNQNVGGSNVPNKSVGQSNTSAKTFYMELEERMKQIAKQAENRQSACKDGEIKTANQTNGVVKTLLPNVIVNEGGYRSVIQLSSVQPFVPNKGYRPVPFKVPAVLKDDVESR